MATERADVLELFDEAQHAGRTREISVDAWLVAWRDRTRTYRRERRRDEKQTDRLYRWRWRCEPLPAPHRCECGQSFATPVALHLHRESFRVRGKVCA